MATSYQHQNLVVVPEDDPLEAISRQGAQRMLTVALEREVEEYLERQRYRPPSARLLSTLCGFGWLVFIGGRQ